MADRKDDLGARRWFRERLARLGTEYPELKEPDRQRRLAETLHQQSEEDMQCPENQPGTPEADPRVQGT